LKNKLKYNNQSWLEKLKSYSDRIQGKKYVKKTQKALTSVIKSSEEEVKETREMADAFFRLLANKLNLKNRKTPPTEEEVKAAIEQLKDVGRIGIFATVSILPGGGFSLIGLELLARKYGIKSFTFIPSAFRKNLEKEKNDKPPTEDQAPD